MSSGESLQRNILGSIFPPFSPYIPSHSLCNFPMISTSSFFLQMPPNLSRSLFVFLFILSHHFPRSLCLDDYYYSTCTSSSGYGCGPELGKVEYPFWVSGHQPDYCGHPAFKLECEDSENEEYATIEIRSQKYKVLRIHRHSQILNIVTMNNAWAVDPLVCPESPEMESTLFQYNSNVPRVNFTLAYNCSHDVEESRYNSCKIDGKGPEAYLTTNILLANKLKYGCVNSTDITEFPVLESEFSSVDGEVGKVLRAGFEVKWTANNELCRKCIRSGGTCGYNNTANEACCFCRDRPHQTTCSNSSMYPFLVKSGSLFPVFSGFSLDKTYTYSPA